MTERQDDRMALNNNQTGGFTRQPPYGSGATDTMEMTGVNESIARVKNSTRRKNRLRIGSIAAILSIILAGGTAALIYKTQFKIANAAVVGEGGYNAEQLMKAAGISFGDGLYSFNSVGAERMIIRRYPEISSVKFERGAPSDIKMTVELGEKAYYADLYGELWVLDKNFRVIEKTSVDTAAEQGFIKLKLPDVSDAVAGFKLEYTDAKLDRYLRKLGDAIFGSTIADRIDSVDMRDIYDLKFVCDGKYLVSLGNSEDLEEKLMFVAAVLEESIFKTDNKATIDVSEISEASVIINNQLVFD